jgi:hypothetical protein
VSTVGIYPVTHKKIYFTAFIKKPVPALPTIYDTEKNSGSLNSHYIKKNSSNIPK